MNTGKTGTAQREHAVEHPTRIALGSSADPRFTIDGDAALERHLARTCARVSSGIRGLIPAQKLEAVVLGGGYGRGEGGVLRSGTGDRPYNDLEFYVALRGNHHVNEIRFHRRLEALGEILTHLADAEVEFKITSLSEIGSKPAGMFLYDLCAGHRVLWANPSVQIAERFARHLRPELIPKADATLLLMNRCTGLLLARSRLSREPFTASVADFAGRNIAKAQLAFGDALLAAEGCYHWSCRERNRRLAGMALSKSSPWLDALLRHHESGVEFKLHPVASASTRNELLDRHAEVTALALKCWLWLEARRLGRAFPTAMAYAADPRDKCPGTSRIRNVLLNLRAGVLRSGPRPWRHPRQRILRALAILLWEPGAMDDPALAQRVRGELGLGGTGDWQPAYMSLWSKVR
jgi:hypothetical protein